MDGIFTQIGPLRHQLLLLLRERKEKETEAEETGENLRMKRNREVVSQIEPKSVSEDVDI